MARQQHLAPNQLPDLIRVMLVTLLLASAKSLANQANITDDPQPTPSAVSTIEYERQPPLQYLYDSNKHSAEPEGSFRTSSGSASSSNQSTPTQDVRHRQSAELIMATTGQPTTSMSPAVAISTSTAGATNSQQPLCTLGDDTFQIGERWNPNLPPFGVQVCVICECTVRQRKNCYETKTTCRRITNECPVIDSCPDGKKPITVAGQCCKTCQSSNLAQQEGNSQVQQQQSQILGNQSPAYESQASRGDQQQTPFKIVYMNERTKEYLSMMKNLPACPNRDSESRPTPANAPTAPTQSSPKAPKGGRNDINGIDTRLAFKSLSDAASNYLMPSKSPHDDSSKRMESPSPEDNHQHPNDVQYASSSNNNNLSPQSTYGRKSHQYNSSGSPHNCILGNDTFQVGDVWNPILPPLGVQVCVRCNCIFRLRRGCYETKLTCRRVNKDCPVIESCPDGRPPVTVSGQCCKSCPTLMDNVEQQPAELTNDTAGAIIPSYITLDGIQRNEKVYREFQDASRNLNVCIRTRETSDIYGVNRYARRSRRSSSQSKDAV